VIAEDTPNFSIDPQGGMNPPAEFTHNGHQVEIVPPDTAHLIGSIGKSRSMASFSAIFCSAHPEWRQTKRKS